MATRVSSQLELQVHRVFEKGPATINEVASRCNINYYTARKIVREMQANNVILTHGFKDRSEQFRLNNNREIPKHYIPNLVSFITREHINAFRLVYKVQERNDSRGLDAVRNLPVYVMRLFYLAYRINSGELDAEATEKNLHLLKREVQMDYNNLKNVEHFYEQILGNNKFWESDFLKLMVDDLEFDVNVLLEIYETVYGTG